MPIVLENTAPKLREIDGIGYTPEDVANAKVWATGKGFIEPNQRGALKGEYVTAWYNDGAHEYEEAKPKTNRQNDDDEVASLFWHKIGKNGVVSARKEYETPITRGMVRDSRDEGDRTKFTASDYMNTVKAFLEIDMAPYRIVTAKGDVFEVSKDEESGEFTATSNEAATKSALTARIKELTARVEELEAELAGADEEEE